MTVHAFTCDVLCTLYKLWKVLCQTQFSSVSQASKNKENGNIKIIKAVQIFISFELFVSRRDPVNGVKIYGAFWVLQIHMACMTLTWVQSKDVDHNIVNKGLRHFIKLTLITWC